MLRVNGTGVYLSLYKGAVHPVHAMNAEQRQTAADPWTKPTDLSHWPACIYVAKKLHRLANMTNFSNAPEAERQTNFG